MTEKTAILFQASTDFKEALGTYAQQKNMAASEVIRLAVAEYIDYDMSGDTITSGRPKKYANKEERLEAQRQKQKQDRMVAKQLMEDFLRAQRRGDVKTFEEYLARRVKMGFTTADD